MRLNLAIVGVLAALMFLPPLFSAPELPSAGVMRHGAMLH